MPAVEVSNDGDSRGKWISAGSLAGVYGALTLWSYIAWYHNKEQLPEFTVNGDGWFGQDTYAGGSDKLGHLWGNLVISRLTTKILRAGGWRKLPASVIASSLSLAFFTYVEIKDGFYYQFSTGDMVGNVIGAGLSVLMVNVPRVDELIDFRVEYRPTSEYINSLTESGDVNVVEDYSGQTYMLALHLKGFDRLARSKWFGWTQYVDIVGGFQSVNYKPEPANPDAPRNQSLFMGVALNMQHLLGAAFGDRPHRSRAKRWAHGVGNMTFEFMSMPFTTLRAVNTSRSPDGSP